MKKVLSIFLALIMIMSTMACLATTASASYDSMSTARNVTMGTTYSGSISSSDKNEFYKITLSSSSKLTMSFSLNAVRCYIYLFDANGNQMERVYQYMTNAGVIYYNPTYTLVSGTYYVKFEYYEGAGSYNVTFTSESSNETFPESQTNKQNTLQTANTIYANREYTGQLAWNDDSDYYKLTLSSSSLLKILFNGKFARMYFYIFDENGSQITRDYAYKSNTGEIVFNKSIYLLKGVYYIKVEQYEGYGNYTFEYSTTSSGETFTEIATDTNNTMATADSVGFSSTYKGLIAYNDKIDFYRFTVTTKSQVKFNFTAYAVPEMVLYLFDADGKQLNKDYVYDGSNGNITFNEVYDLDKGTYYLKIEYYDGYGNYSFNFSKYVETPTVSSTNALNGVQISWNEIPGASKYTVFRRQGGSSTWVNLGTTTGTSYLDKNVKSGTYYCYTVRAFSADGSYSAYESGKTSTRKYMATPKLTTIYNHQNGLAIKWNAVAGVTNGYRVYRRGTGSTSWTYLGTTKNLYFIDSQVKNRNGEYYRYTVIADGGYHSKFDTTGLYLRRLANPTLNSAVSSKSGITVKWGKVAGSSGYYVYRKTANSTWTRIAVVKGVNSASYLDKTARKGTTYTYTVRAVYGNTLSSYYSGISCKDKY